MIVRCYQPEDKENVVNLLRQSHDRTFSKERFEWLHERNLMAPSDITVTNDGDNIIGFYAIIKKQVSISGTHYLAGRNIDAVVHPAYRGKGIFSQMLSYSLNTISDVDLFFNFANDLAAPSYLRNGWKRIGYLLDYICQVHYNNYLSKEFLAHMASYALVRRVRHVTTEKTNIEEFLLKDSLDPVIPRNRIGVCRSIDYIRWRYVKNPIHKYNYYVQYDNSSPLVLAVVKPDKNNVLHVLDIISFRNRTYDMNSLVSCWAKDYPKSKIIIWSSTPKEARNCFVKKPFKNRGISFFVRVAQNKVMPNYIYDLNRWFITHGDLEFL